MRVCFDAILRLVEIQCLRKRSDRRRPRWYFLSFKVPITLHNSSPFHWALPLLRYYHDPLWYHHSLHRLYQNLAPDDRITRPPRHLHVGDLPWFELSHQHLVHSQRIATPIRFPTVGRSIYWPLALL